MPFRHEDLKPLVTVVIPNYNYGRFLDHALGSLVLQDFHNWEAIVVDNFSTDNSEEVVATMQDERIRVFSMYRNSGPAVVRNKAIEESRGQYIAFLDSDDLWVPTKLEIQIGMMRERKSLFCFASYTPFRVDGLPLPVIRAPETVGYKKMLYGSVIGCLTVIYDASVIGKRYFTEGRDEIAGTIYARMIKKLGHEDYALWLSILKDCDAGLYPGLF